MRVVVFAYNVLGGVGLKALIKHGYDVCALITHEDDPNEKIYFDSVASIAEQHNIKVFKPQNPNAPEFISELKKLAPEAIFSFYYRLMLSEDILSLVSFNAYNLHGSLLPKYRGRSPLNWALLHGEKEAGVTLHKMVKKADRGEIVDQEGFPITRSDDICSLQPKMKFAAEVLLDRALPLIIAGKEQLTLQDESKASYFGGRKAEDGKIYWDKPAEDIFNLIRAVTDPFPGAFMYYNGNKIIIWKAEVYDKNKSNNERAGEVISTEPFLIATGNGVLAFLTGKIANGPNLDSKAIAEKLNIKKGSILD